MISRRSLAAIAAWLAVSAAAADVIVMKTGEQITGKVTRFERGKTSLANSHFLVNVDGEEQEIPLFKIDTVTFDGVAAAPPAASPRPLPAAGLPPAKSAPGREADSNGGAYCLSSSGKRHNSSWRYYGSSKCRSCGPRDGVACKICGG